MSTGCPSAGNSPAKSIEDMMMQDSLAKIRNKILVMSGKGGVGKSTISANIALALSEKGCKVGLLDIDLHGPDIGILLGIREKSPEHHPADPISFSENLKFISIEYLMADKDQAVIWRGPLKYKAIRTFLSDVRWGELDYLVIDAPPGTGDEPLTIAQTICDAQAVIVTTPQEVSLSDVRKSIHFCRKANLKILGMIENMSGFSCPHCDKEIALFKKGGGERLALEMNVPFLGRIPIEPEIVSASDDGKPYMAQKANLSKVAGMAFSDIAEKILAKGTGCLSGKSPTAGK